MLKKYSFKVRILLFVVPLLLGLTMILAKTVYESYAEWKSTSHIMRNIQYVDKASELIHELQKERGKSALFLNGKIDREALSAQRIATNGKYTEIKESVAILNEDLSGFESRIQEIKKGIDLLRERVDQTIPVAESGAKYSEAIKGFLMSQREVALSDASNGREAKIASLGVFEAAKESLGRARALSSSILSADKPLSREEVFVLLGLWTGVSSNLQSPGLMISEETRQGVQDLTASTDWKDVQKVFETVAAKSEKGDYGIDPNSSFAAFTKSIEGLYSQIHHESDLIINEVAKAQASAWQSLLFVLVTTLLGEFLLVTFALITIQDISKNVTQVGTGLSHGADATVAASSQLKRSAESLSQNMTEQSSALQETVSSLDEVRAMVAKNAENADRARSLAGQTLDETQKGKIAIEEMVGAIGKIQDSNEAVHGQVEASNSQLGEIIKVISEINGKTKVINDIVFQTKLLSFNASVEAARAGEHGKGFAVVAEEVGNLAEMSGAASKEIAQLLETSLQRVEGIISNTKTKVGGLVEEVKEKIDSGIQTAERCEKILDGNLKHAQEVRQMVEEIATASHEQAQGVNEISKAMNQLETVTQESTMAANETSAAAIQLDAQGIQLKVMSAQLSQVVFGAHVPIEKPQEKKRASPVASVLQFKKPMAKVSGSDVVPESDDPRFEDV